MAAKPAAAVTPLGRSTAVGPGTAVGAVPPGGGAPSVVPAAPSPVPHKPKPARYNTFSFDLSDATQASDKLALVGAGGAPVTAILVRGLPAAAAGNVGVRIGSVGADPIPLVQVGDCLRGFADTGGVYLYNVPAGQQGGPAVAYPAGTIVTLVIAFGGSLESVA